MLHLVKNGIHPPDCKPGSGNSGDNLCNTSRTGKRLNECLTSRDQLQRVCEPLHHLTEHDNAIDDLYRRDERKGCRNPLEDVLRSTSIRRHRVEKLRHAVKPTCESRCYQTQPSTENVADLFHHDCKRVNDSRHLRLCVFRHTFSHSAVLLVDDAEQRIERFGCARNETAVFIERDAFSGKILFGQAEHRECFGVWHEPLVQFAHHADKGF